MNVHLESETDPGFVVSLVPIIAVVNVFSVAVDDEVEAVVFAEVAVSGAVVEMHASCMRMNPESHVAQIAAPSVTHAAPIAADPNSQVQSFAERRALRASALAVEQPNSPNLFEYGGIWTAQLASAHTAKNKHCGEFSGRT